jgi:hypothetical protein
MSPDSKQIQLSSSSRGITDHFFCFNCDQFVWDCDHLIDVGYTAWSKKITARRAYCGVGINPVPFFLSIRYVDAQLVMPVELCGPPTHCEVHR